MQPISAAPDNPPNTRGTRRSDTTAFAGLHPVTPQPCVTRANCARSGKTDAKTDHTSRGPTHKTCSLGKNRCTSSTRPILRANAPDAHAREGPMPKTDHTSRGPTPNVFARQEPMHNFHPPHPEGKRARCARSGITDAKTDRTSRGPTQNVFARQEPMHNFH